MDIQPTDFQDFHVNCLSHGTKLREGRDRHSYVKCFLAGLVTQHLPDNNASNEMLCTFSVLQTCIMAQSLSRPEKDCLTRRKVRKKY